jgi:Flp pilus assembly protein TadG
MRLRTRLPRQTRRAATIVETAFILAIALLMLFGLFEYCRFVYLNQIMNNAARDGARFAVVHTGDGTTLAQVEADVTSCMAGLDQTVDNFTISVQNVTPSTGQPVAGTTWNDAPFGGAIKVTVSCNYHPMMPTFLQTVGTIPLTATAMMTSEAN